MSIATKTILQQMRFVRAGAPFCSIAAKETIDATNFDYSYQGSSFYGVSTVSDPIPTYTSEFVPVRQGAPFQITALRQIRYGGVSMGAPIFSQTPDPTYTPFAFKPVRQGAPFQWITAKDTIDASSDFVIRGAPFYVYYGGPPPVITFDATRMFLLF